ncbi:MAG: pitrilysin family protein, partial [Gammaproteobacteria bacterium]|nr:pitrilysin family protein [Gammaproteobacteria bacterium]
MKWTANVSRRVFPNGLTLLVERNDSAAVVAVVTHVRAGYFDEPDEWVGISHVLEHMFFKGTSRRGPGDIARETQILGGYLNAATIYDKTVYYTVLPSRGDGLPKAIDVQADALIQAALDPDELRRELEVIIQEANRKLDAPAAVTRETLYGLLFSVHRMRRWRIGSEKGLRALGTNDVRAYYSTRYAPERVIVAIVGDLDVDQAFEIAENYYGNWKAQPSAVDRSPTEPESHRVVSRVLNGDVTRPLADVGWRTVGSLHADTPVLDMAAIILGAGRGSRLYRAVRTPGLAGSVGASHYTPTEVGVFDVSFESDARQIDDAVDRGLEVVSDLAATGPSAEELERARALVATRWARQFESMDGRASALCAAEALGSYEIVDDLFERTSAVNAEDIQRVAAQYLNPNKACAVFYLEREAQTRFVNGGWPAADAADRPTIGTGVGTVVGVRSGVPSGHLSDGEPLEYDGGIIGRSLRGIDLLVWSKPGSGMVSIGLHIPDIPLAETEANAGISRLLVRCANRGADGKSGESWAQGAELLGGPISTSASVDGIGWSMTVRPDAASDAAWMLRTVALHPNLDVDDVEVERALQANDARRLQDDMFRYPIDRVIAAAFPGDSYGHPQMGYPEVVQQLTVEEVRAWSQEVSAHRAVAVAVGDLDAEPLLDSLAPLADWPGVRNGHSTSAAPTFHSGRAHGERDKAQSALAMAFPAFPIASRERDSLTVVTALLSGLAGRLFEELREKRSLAYTVTAMPWLRKRTGAVITYIATSPEREEEARDAMVRELYRLVNEQVLVDELERARNYAAGLVEIGQQSGATVASKILGGCVYGFID